MASPSTIRLGSVGSDVTRWQTILNQGQKPSSWSNAAGVMRQWAADWSWPLTVDGSFGAKTEAATEAWQAEHGLTADGIVGAASWSVAVGPDTDPAPPSPSLPPLPYPFVQARNFTPANRTKIDVIVIHDMEYPERPGGAMWCANFFAGPSAPQASAHFAVDNQSVVQCVKEKDVAWHAPGTNRNGIGIEHAGYAAQSRDQWLDDYSTAELKLSAQLVAVLCARWDIPIVKLSMDDLQAGKRGICGHLDATMAFSNGKGHTDPGPSFPWPEYIQWVKDAAGA